MRRPRRTKRNKRRLLWALAAVAVLVLSAGGVTAARYVLRQQGQGVAEAAGFYFTSDLLREVAAGQTPPEYYIDPASAGITVHLYNYADALRTSQAGITYSVTAAGASVTGGSGVLAGGGQNSAEITIAPQQGTAAFTVTAQATAPYTKTLQAKFILAMGNRYAIEDEAYGRAATLTMTCADDAKEIALALPAGVYPDAGDDRVKKSDTGYLFESPGHGVYSLVLLKENTAANLTQAETEFAETITIPAVGN